jgi:GDPmannose 4,6-dehydratase
LFTDKNLVRPTKTGALIGDISKAKKHFGFDPKVNFKRLVRILVDANLKIKKDR